MFCCFVLIGTCFLNIVALSFCTFISDVFSTSLPQMLLPEITFYIYWHQFVSFKNTSLISKQVFPVVLVCQKMFVPIVPRDYINYITAS